MDTTKQPEERPLAGFVARKIPALTIISHPSMVRAGERVVMDRPSLEISRSAPDFGRRGQRAGGPLDDPYLSRKPFVLSEHQDGSVSLRLDQHGSSVSVAGQPLSEDVTLQPEQLKEGVPIVLCTRIVLLLHLVEQRPRWPDDDLGMVGESDAIQEVRQWIRTVVVDHTVPVLIRGETGTGKEHVAKALHDQSKRPGRFVSHDMSTIPEGLVASELFGAKKGSYTDQTTDCPGLFRAAHRGTLFLDEIANASPQVQATLLRALETGKIKPVGATVEEEVDVRLIAATDADIEARSKDGKFRTQLLYRLAGYEIVVPALQKRPEDIGLLFAHFAKQELETLGEPFRLEAQDPDAAPWLPADLAVLLLRHEWPGNVRELRNVTRRLVLNHRGQAALTVDEKLKELQSKPKLEPELQPQQPLQPNPGSSRPKKYSCEELRAALKASNYDIAAAAKDLDLVRSTLQTRLKRCGIRTITDIKDEEIKRAHQECGADLKRMAERLEVSVVALKPRLGTLGLKVSLRE